MTYIGIGGSGNDSRSAAQIIDHSLEIFDTISNRNKFDSQRTYSSEGWTCEESGRKLDGVWRVRDAIEDSISRYTLHSVNLIFSSTTGLTMESRGLKKRPALHCLHSAYNSSISYRRKEWDSLWQLINNEDCVYITSPGVSRLECVGEMCEDVINNVKIRETIFTHIMQA